MNEKEIEKIIHMNQRLLMIVGYAMAFVCPYGKTLDGIEKERYQWLLNAVDNVIYLDKTLPMCP